MRSLGSTWNPPRWSSAKGRLKTRCEKSESRASNSFRLSRTGRVFEVFCTRVAIFFESDHPSTNGWSYDQTYGYW
jgi:hypothetical protein